MTIQAAPSEQSYAADGVSTVFVIPFPFDTSADLKLTSTDASGNIVTLSTGFTVTGGAGLTGNATFSVAPAAGLTITIYDNPALTQPTNYVSLDAFPAESHERALDRVTRIAKRLYQLVQRSVRFPDGDVSTDGVLGSVANRKGKYLFFNAITGAIEYAANIVTTTLSQSVIGGLLTPQTAAETASGVTPVNLFDSPWVYDVRRVGIVPNSSGAASANTVALKALLNPAVTGITGKVIFPNTTGADVYYFNGIIPIRDGVKLDGMGCTINFTKTGVSADTNAGFFHAIRDVTIENMTIVVAYTYVAGSNTGNALAFGNRSTDAGATAVTAAFSPLYDSLLASRMGNIVVRNVRVSTNAGANGNGVLMIGGFDGVTFENFFLDGQGTLSCAINYEFGWATNEALAQNRQTSHARNMQFHNVRLTNLDTTSGIGINLGGAYNCLIDGLYCNSMANAVTVTCAEALFYRPWSGNDGAGSKRGIHLRNIVGSTINAVGLNLIGAQLATGYLNPLGLGAVSQTDLLDVEVDGFALVGTVNNHGVSSSAGRLILRNGQLTGFQHGINLTQECTEFLIEGVRVLNSTDVGIFIGQGVSIYAPARFSSGIIRKCFVAGSGVVGGASAGVAIATTTALVIEACRFGYELIHDTLTETTQTYAVSVGADATGVVCRSNYVAGVSGGFAAYNLVSGSTSHRNCTIEQASGIQTTSGIWKSVLDGVSQDRGDNNITLSALADFKRQMFQSALTVNRTITVNSAGAVAGDRFRVVRTGLGAFTLAVGALKTIPAGTAAFVDIEYDAVSAGWRLTGYGTL